VDVDPQSPQRPIVAAVVLLLDVLGAAMALIVLVTTVAGPWTVTVGGQLLRVRSTGNLIVGLLLVAALRSLAPACPLLAIPAWSLLNLRRRASTWLETLSRRLDAVDARTALRVVGILIVVASAVRVANVFAHFGFLTGDDVEIHEMTLGVALGKAWPVWDLRSAFYPMGFIFPVQRALVALGVTDVFSLVAAGRLVVTAIAGLNVWILYRVGLSLYGDRGTALIAAALLGVNHLHMAYGSAELPRIVATAFLVPAFAALWTPTPLRCGLAGVLLGLGASLRFGEIVFAVPAVLSVLFGSRDDVIGGAWRVRVARAAAILVGTAVTFLLAIGISDALYWGRPFHSLLAIVDYTLVQRLSSRGYEPAWYYLTHLSEWSDVLLVVLACLAWEPASRRALLWAALPLALLSVLPHKEARYAIATIPFWALAAAPALRSWIAHGYVRAPLPLHVRVGALGIALLVAAAVAFDAGKFRFVRSEAAVRLGWAVGQSGAGIAAEQLWRFGGRLYFDPSMPLVEIDLQGPDAEGLLREAVCRPDVRWTALRLRPLTADTTAVLNECGLAADVTATEAGYQLFRKRP
jgi:phosphatidylinositol glycan class B